MVYEFGSWVGLVDVGNVVSKGRQIDEDFSEETVDGGDGAVFEGGASQDKTIIIKRGERTKRRHEQRTQTRT